MQLIFSPTQIETRATYLLKDIGTVHNSKDHIRVSQSLHKMQQVKKIRFKEIMFHLVFAA